MLALWWQEAAGKLRRADLAVALDLSPAHAAVRVARMKERLVTSRTVVRALRRVPPCPSLAAITGEWDREPSPLWRKRLARHVRDCPWCVADTGEMIPAERLLGGLPLIAVPAGLAAAALARVAGGPAGVLPGRARAGRPRGRPCPTGPAEQSRPAHGAAVEGLRRRPAEAHRGVGGAGDLRGRRHVRGRPRPRGGGAGRDERRRPPAARTAGRQPVPLATHTTRLRSGPRPSRQRRRQPAPVTVTSERKGVATWNTAGVSQDLAASGASWYYDWGANSSGITAPASASFVPMIWGPSDVTAATLDQVKSEGDDLLGFNEPDQGGQANMTVAQALSLWPQLMATGMTLGSPAVSYDAATPGGWLDQFMAGAKARGYRVNFITVHWYGGDFSTGPAVQQLESYLQAIYDRYHLPIWITEFALTSYAGSTATFPSEAQQAAFLTAATAMLDGLPYVQRYAWFALPVSAGSGTTGLFNVGPVATAVGRAFEAAR